MQIRLGYELALECPHPTPMILMLRVHPSRQSDLHNPDSVTTAPSLPITDYSDAFGNICSRVVAPAGIIRFTADAIIEDSGALDDIDRDAIQHDVELLPEETLPYLLGSRYCDTDQLSRLAWSQFGNAPIRPTGWQRVQEICDFVHARIQFGYQHARSTRTASEAYAEQVGVCRDFAHLAIALCRCMNIPARYCTGYLGDIAVPKDPAPMDFSAWFEAYIGGRWYSFDARHNQRRVGRVVIARGRDAADVAIVTAFGPHVLHAFKVWTDEVPVSVHAEQRVA
jgi:transglutaminase-like putative cysteine protease